MQYFKVSKRITIKAWNYETRYSWGHKARLYADGDQKLLDTPVCDYKITYYNRTWERFTYESILYAIIEKALKQRHITKRQAIYARKWIKEYQAPNPFKHIAMVAKMGEVLAPDQKARNDWKARMLKAGLGNKGLTMPDDWAELSEDEKERRLDQAIKAIE